MNPERWMQIERLHRTALEYEPKDRANFIAEACEGDSELRREVESLLASSGMRETLPQNPAVEMAASVPPVGTQPASNFTSAVVDVFHCGSDQPTSEAFNLRRAPRRICSTSTCLRFFRTR